MASLVEAIQTAENHSTGEVRVHIDSTTEGHNAEIAFEVFKTLCKDKTEEQNAVLFHDNFEKFSCCKRIATSAMAPIDSNSKFAANVSQRIRPVPGNKFSAQTHRTHCFALVIIP